MSSASAEVVARDAYFPLVKALLIEATGLTYYSGRDEELARRIARRLSSQALADCGAYLALLRRSPQELDAVIAELTIGETYFFREPEQLEALRDIVLPDVLERNASTRRLRIWSAGCATGAEPYSVAILLKRDLGARLAGWDVSVIGTDINRHSLARAEEASFGDWELRTAGEDLVCQCFLPSGKAWVLRPEYREGVTFQYHNLVQHPFPSFATGFFGFDVILCRNVLIYFASEVVGRLLEQFRRALVEGGWLLVGHAEPNVELFQPFRTVLTPGATLYQKAGEGRRTDATTPISALDMPLTAPALLAVPEPPAPRPSAIPREGGPNASRPRALEAGDGLAVVRLLGDQGRLSEALRACDRLLEGRALEALVHFHRALILDQLGQSAEAELSLRQALYLDRRFSLAHFHLALLLHRRQDRAGARRSLENTIRTLAGRRPEEAVMPDERLAVSDLRAMAEMQLEVLGAR